MTQLPRSNTENTGKLVAAWLFVGLPFAWGVFVSVKNALALFH